MNSAVVTARPGSVCTCAADLWHRIWQMKALWHGAIDALVVTELRPDAAQEYEDLWPILSAFCRKSGRWFCCDIVPSKKGGDSATLTKAVTARHFMPFLFEKRWESYQTYPLIVCVYMLSYFIMSCLYLYLHISFCIMYL